MAGRIDYYFLPIAPALPVIADGKLKALAVSTPKRAAQGDCLIENDLRATLRNLSCGRDADGPGQDAHLSSRTAGVNNS